MLNQTLQVAYPQALARLLAITQDVNLAEDCLQMATEQALVHWQKTMPDNPVAWLVKVGRNRLIDYYRYQKKFESFEHTDWPNELADINVEIDLSEQALLQSYNDDLLRLIFTSCHPALNSETQITLALKHVLGLNVEQIASALVIPKKTLQQRLVRAKKKIIANGIEYDIPAPERWQERLSSVLATIYLLFNEGHLSTNHSAFITHDLCKEAIRLCRLLHQCIRGEPEIIGLLALLLQLDARLPARVDASGNMILLADQDRNLWKKNNIAEANQLVEKALLSGKGTPYAIQAAIASLHNNAVSFDKTDWQQIYSLYLVLIRLDKNPIIKLNAAIALSNYGKRDAAIKKIKSLQPELENYRHYYTALAGIYIEGDEFSKAKSYYQKALKYTDSTAELNFIHQQIQKCNK